MSDGKKNPIVVLGAGSFGTALAILLTRNGNETRLWGRKPEHIESMSSTGFNQQYLPEVPLPKSLGLFDSFEESLKDVKDILIATPSHAFEETLKKIEKYRTHQVRIVWACKGLEPNTGGFLCRQVIKLFGNDIPKAVLSGPTFAKELAAGSPTAITLASDNEKLSTAITDRLVNETFRVYLSEDIAGVQFGGAIKNVIAIGAGIADGLGFGSNARTALITRGLAEMMRLGTKLGGKTETFTGMAGLGDLVLTCTDNQSRNRRFGLALGKGASLDQAAKDIGQVVEGVRNTKEVYNLAKFHGIDMPICQSVYDIIYNNQDPRTAAKDLLTRAMKVEGD